MNAATAARTEVEDVENAILEGLLYLQREAENAQLPLLSDAITNAVESYVSGGRKPNDRHQP